jgi:hypothetical protein
MGRGTVRGDTALETMAGAEGVKFIKMRTGIMSLETSLCKITIGL